MEVRIGGRHAVFPAVDERLEPDTATSAHLGAA